MKTIILKKLSLVNFKGLRSFEVNFDSVVTVIKADNGKGKSTLFDALTWLLFGKDHKDRKQFGIKTYDENNVVIPRLPHEVSGTLIVDGEEVTLRRCFNEKWTKKRGDTEKTFTGHEEERYYNDIPCTVNEWNEKIESICPEQVFKFITNPHHFTAQETEVQRAMLYRMIGGINDRDIADGNPEFTALLDKLSGKSLDEYRKEIASKKKRIKVEIDSIPERIDERKRDMPDPEDWDMIEAGISAKQDELERVEEAIMDDVKRQDNENTLRLDISNRLLKTRQDIADREFAIKEDALKDFRTNESARNEIQDRISALEREITRSGTRYKEGELEHAAMTTRRLSLLETYQRLNVDAKTVSAEQPNFSEEDFRCPTCGRVYDTEDIEIKQSELVANFETRKKRRLNDIASEIERNITQGKKVKSSLLEIESEMAAASDTIKAKTTELEALRKELEAFTTNEMPDISPLINSDEYITKLRQTEKELTQKLEEPSTAKKEMDDSLTVKRKAIIADIEILKTRLAGKDYIIRNQNRINELESRLRNLCQELAGYEKEEHEMDMFTKAKIEMTENRINELFSIVRFKMFDTQINGAQIETCEAILNGVPYSDCSTAEQINIGLDIINAICRFEKIAAPCFIDNAESINRMVSTLFQIIKLQVTTDDHLVVEYPAKDNNLFS